MCELFNKYTMKYVCCHCPNDLRTTYELFKHDEMVNSYGQYLKNSKKRFRDKSWPFCYECYNKTTTCDKCLIPLLNSPIYWKTSACEISIKKIKESQETFICKECSDYLNWFKNKFY